MMNSKACRTGMVDIRINLAGLAWMWRGVTAQHDITARVPVALPSDQLRVIDCAALPVAAGPLQDVLGQQQAGRRVGLPEKP